MVLGGGLLHVGFEYSWSYNSGSHGDNLDRRDKPHKYAVWSAKYCSMEGKLQHSTALTTFESTDTKGEKILEYRETNPHHQCHQKPQSCSGLGNDAQDLSTKNNKPSLQILRTCHQAYIEATRVLWATNTFSFNDPFVLKKFMQDRKPSQKQVLKRLHLDMDWNPWGMKREWEKALGVTLVKALKGVSTLHLFIQSGSSSSSSLYELGPTSCEQIMKLKMLPLKSATVNIVDSPESRGTRPLWSVARRTEFAHHLTVQLLDPEGPARWREEEDYRNEVARHEKEERAEAWAQSMCYGHSTQELCAEDRQQRQDKKDKITGRVRKEETKVAGPCGRQHMCLVCFRADESASKEENMEKVRTCPRPGTCQQTMGLAECLLRSPVAECI